MGLFQPIAESRPHFATGAIINVITPQVIADLKGRLDPTAKSLNDEVNGCAALSADTKTSWSYFYKGWRDYADADPPSFYTFGMGSIYDSGIAYQDQLIAWQKLLNTTCTSTTPPLVRQDEDTQKTASTLEHMGLIAIGLGAIGLVVMLKK
jgi:hypothetical protein